jgi:SAM-dependent methyltransferase
MPDDTRAPDTRRTADEAGTDQLDVIELFDEPGLWRASAATALGYGGLDLATAVAPGAGFPAVLTALADHLEVGPADIVVDIGAGLGGASAWLASLTGAQVVAVEPAAGSRAAAQRLFPQLLVLDGRADLVPVADASVAAATAIGVCSLLDDLDGFLAEVTRVLRAGGRLGVADLFLVDGDERAIGPNTFRSVPQVTQQLESAGFRVVEVGCGPPEPAEHWAAPQRTVDAEIARRHDGDDIYPAWRADQEHLASLVDDQVVMSGCVVATWSPGQVASEK